jgi:hypothetical protein
MDPGKRPLDDEFDRAEFYRGIDPEVEDDDEEYELAPPDEDLLEAERRRAREVVEQAQLAVDFEQLERAEREFAELDAKVYLDRLKFQFGTKHLLIAMAVLAVALVVGMVVDLLPILLVGSVALLAAAYGYLTWREAQQREELEARRAELYERKKQQREAPAPPNR